MNLTKHFSERWVERIVGITDDKEIREYIGQNQNMIAEHANKTFEYATFIFKGQLGDNITRNYYIEDEIVFITNTTDDAFITVYKVDLGFTSELNSTVRKGLIEEIKRLEQEKEDVEFQILLEVEDKEHEVVSLDDNIKILEEQLKNMKQRKDHVQAEVKSIKSKSLNTGLELKKYVLMLVNSKDYKKDLVSMK